MNSIQRFGASLHRHVHYHENRSGSRASRALAGAQIRARRIGHCCIIGGSFEPVDEADSDPKDVRLRAAAELPPQATAAVTEQVRIRVLRLFPRSGLIEPDDVREMLAPENSGLSLDAVVDVGGQDPAGLERLLQCFTRPANVWFFGHSCLWQPKA